MYGLRYENNELLYRSVTNHSLLIGFLMPRTKLKQSIYSYNWEFVNPYQFLLLRSHFYTSIRASFERLRYLIYSYSPLYRAY